MSRWEGERGKKRERERERERKKRNQNGKREGGRSMSGWEREGMRKQWEGVFECQFVRESDKEKTDRNRKDERTMFGWERERMDDKWVAGRERSIENMSKFEIE